MRSAAVKAIQDALAAIQEDQERIDRLEELFRLEGLANATAQTLRGTADRIMEQQIEPLVAEIARRWKQTFGKEGLQLSPDGRITRTVGGRYFCTGSSSEMRPSSASLARMVPVNTLVIEPISNSVSGVARFSLSIA